MRNQLPLTFLLAVCAGAGLTAQMSNLGGGHPGISGIPVQSVDTLTGAPGSVWPYSQVEIGLSSAAPIAVASLVLGGEIVNLPLISNMQ